MLSGARSVLQRLMGGPSHAPAAAPPNTVIYVVGDIHGRADLLYPLLGKIAFDIAKVGPESGPESGPKSGPEIGRELIFLGDYVDRGPDSRGVIQRVLSATAERDFWTVTALKGNHEAALLQFLEDPLFWPTWSGFGARATLASYGVEPPDLNSGEDDWAQASHALNIAMPASHKAFLSGLGLTAERGDYLCVHAGVKPSLALADQTEEDLLWIRDEFLRSGKRLEKVIVHGHTPANQAYLGEHRIGLDTGAYATSVLTAVRLQGTDRRLIQVHGAEDSRAGL